MQTKDANKQKNTLSVVRHISRIAKGNETKPITAIMVIKVSNIVSIQFSPMIKWGTIRGVPQTSYRKKHIK